MDSLLLREISDAFAKAAERAEAVETTRTDPAPAGPVFKPVPVLPKDPSLVPSTVMRVGIQLSVIKAGVVTRENVRRLNGKVGYANKMTYEKKGWVRYSDVTNTYELTAAGRAKLKWAERCNRYFYYWKPQDVEDIVTILAAP